MMRAEAEMYQAQLKAAETSLDLYRQRIQDEEEMQRFDAQARNLQAGKAQTQTLPDQESTAGSPPSPVPPTATVTPATPSTPRKVGLAWWPLRLGWAPDPGLSGRALLFGGPGLQESQAPAAAAGESKPSSRNNSARTETATSGAAAAPAATGPGRKPTSALTANMDLRSLPSFLPKSKAQPKAAQPEGSDGDAIAEQARLIEEEAAELARAGAALAGGSSVVAAARAHTKQTKGRVSFADELEPRQTAPAVRPAADFGQKPESKPPATKRLSEQYRVDRERSQEEVDALRRMEEEEYQRRDAFDAKLQNLNKELKALGTAPRARKQLELDLMEQEELERRRDWERNREEREARYLMRHPDAGEQLQEYLREREKEEEAFLTQKQEQERSARELVGLGRVRRLAASFRAEPAPSADAAAAKERKSHIMTWKVKEQVVRSALLE